MIMYYYTPTIANTPLMLGSVNNLSELITHLRANSSGKTTEENFDLLQNLVGEHVRVRFEIVKNIDNSSPDEQTEQTTPRGRFNRLNNATVARVLLTSDRQHADFSRELSRQCNGVVLEYPTWRVLSVPAGMFNPKYRFNDIVAKIGDYDVYDIKDGTTVTLYWYSNSENPDDGKWCLSSTNGFDVSGYQWMGPATYLSALTTVMKNYPDFSFDKLDKAKSFTIGFRHKDFHPLLSDLPKMWFIQSCDLSQANSNQKIVISTTENIGLPLQTLSNLPEDVTQLSRWFTDKNSQALSKYFSSARAGTTPSIHYGFVLRSKTGQSDIIIESDLLKTVRNLMYNLPKRQYQNATPITPANRLDYTILRAYLSNTTKFNFLNLFPQFETKFREYDELFGKLSNKIVSFLRNRNPRDSVRYITKNKKAGTLNQRIESLAISLSDHIRTHSQINVMDAQGPSIILDFLMSHKHLDLYYTYLINTE